MMPVLEMCVCARSSFKASEKGISHTIQSRVIYPAASFHTVWIPPSTPANIRTHTHA
jgi:hypothetical protein